MTRARDDKRRNNRREFALYHPRDEYDDDGPRLVGSFSLGYADGCAEGFTEDGDAIWCAIGGPDHDPAEHAEMDRILVEPRRRSARLRGAA